MRYYRRIQNPQDGELIQFLAVYATRWPYESGVPPTEAFVEADDVDMDAAENVMAVLDVILDQVDYTRNNCRSTDPIAAVLSTELIGLARAALAVVKARRYKITECPSENQPSRKDALDTLI